MSGNIINLVLIIFILLIVIVAYNKNYYRGLITSIFFLLLTPYNIFMSLPGQLPNITIHRFIVIVMTLYWVKNEIISKKIGHIPFVKSYSFVVITSIISTITSYVFIASFKSTLGLIIEQLLFYVIVITSLYPLNAKDRIDVQYKIVKCMAFTLTIVAVMGVVERWTGFTVLRYLPSHVEVPSFISGLYQYVGRISSTYPDPILLGYALSMVWPLIFILMDVRKKQQRSSLYLIPCLLVMGSCLYFTSSRGAWISAIIAGVILLVRGSWNIRKKLLMTSLMLITVLIVRPQITDTIMSLVRDTVDVDSFKGRSYNYRFELWGKAYGEISKSPERLLLGYGDKSHERIDWSGYEKKTGLFSTFWSWDNEYAAVLLDRGFLGFIAFTYFYMNLIIRALMRSRFVSRENKDLFYALWTIIVLYAFMMSNVYVFSPQIKFIFWTTIALIFTLEKNSDLIDNQHPIPKKQLLS